MIAVRVIRTACAAGLAVALAAILTGCTGGSPSPGPSSATGSTGGADGTGGTAGATGAPASPDAGATPSPSTTGSPALDGSAMPAPVLRREAHLPGQADRPERAVTVAVYPLQRIDGRVLLTVDVTPARDQQNFNYFCRFNVCYDLSGISLVDPVRLVRYEPLGVAGEKDVVYSSASQAYDQAAGWTYRVAAWFPDPGTSTIAVDLAYAGLASGLPITAADAPYPGTVTDREKLPFEPDETTAPDGTRLRIWPTLRPAADAVVRVHQLVAPVVGGPVDGSGPLGLVAIDADVLFDFDSARLTPAAAAVIAKAAAVLAATADPGKPVTVVGHTDTKGGSSFNQTLSQKRAAAVVAALRPLATGFSLAASGKGETQPVAPNDYNGKDNPAGRALNRRVEIGYTPRAAPAASPSPAASQPAAQPADAAAGASSPPDAGPATGAAPAATIGPFTATYFDGSVLTAAVHPVRRIGALAVVELDLVATGKASQAWDVLSATGRAGRDVGALHVVDPATKKAYLPASDADERTRYLGSDPRADWLPGVPYRMFVVVAAPAPSVRSVTVDAGRLGQAKNVPVL